MNLEKLAKKCAKYYLNQASVQKSMFLLDNMPFPNKKTVFCTEDSILKTACFSLSKTGILK